MPRFPSSLNPTSIALLAALWIGSFSNWPLWRALTALPEMSSLRGAVFVIGFAVAVTALTFALLALFASRFTIKPVAALFLLAAAFGAHFMGTYGVVIDPTMMVNVLQTDARETRDLMSWRMVFTVLLLAGLPLWALWRLPARPTSALRQIGRNAVAIAVSLALVMAIVFALFADLSATMRNHKHLRYLINPLNSFFALGALATQSGARPAGPPVAIGLDAAALPRAADAKPPLLLLVVGETARADHFSLNGYARPTNAELAERQVLSFAEVSSCGTSTAASLPCMFSHLGRKAFDGRDRDRENLLDVLQRAGYAVLWLDNQAGCKGLCSRVPNAMAGDPPGGDASLVKGLCGTDGECLDEALMRGLDKRLAAMPSDKRSKGVVIVLHQMGSHGPAYYKRSPVDRKRFLPECTTNVLQQCERDSLVNAYDNSIAYTDHVLALGIDWLKERSSDYASSMFYVSDHGESLGENNLYLHGLPYAVAPQEQTHVPMVVWLPAQHAWTPCLAAQIKDPLSHDHLFHTVLGLVGIRSSEYKAAFDITAKCAAR
jgi:lipid A ethanolaminephosphotransferase